MEVVRYDKQLGTPGLSCEQNCRKPMWTLGCVILVVLPTDLHNEEDTKEIMNGQLYLKFEIK